ncbi:MAG: replicative DNA helicase [Treponemataceae bacterium]
MATQLKDKIPPHNMDAEQATLGAVLYDWDAIDRVHNFLTPDKFYLFQHQKIYSALLDLYNKGVRGDLVSVQDELSKRGELDSCGGTAYISELAGKVPTSANVEYYAQIVLDQAVRRDLIKTASNLVLYAHDDTKRYTEVLEDAQKSIFELTEISSSHTFNPIKDLIPKTMENIARVFSNKNELSGVPSGFPSIDRMTSGFQNSEMIILGARPSIGKTAMALSMLHHIAVEKKIPAAFFSLEMADVQIVQRLLVQQSRIRSDKLRNGFMTHNEYSQLGIAAGALYESPLFIVDAPNMNLLDLRAVARRLKEQYDIKIMFVDYIGLIGGEVGQKDYERVSEASRSLKSLARELRIPIVVLSQVARSSEGKAPSLAELRDSGSIEQDADVVMFLHRERKATAESGSEAIDTEVHIAKQRNGPTGMVKLAYFPAFTKFENCSDYRDNM